MPEGEEKGITFQDYLYIIFARRWIIISVFLITFVSTAIYTLTAPKTYEANAVLMIEPESAPGTILEYGYSPWAFQPVNIQKYCERLKSRDIAQATVDKLKVIDNSSSDLTALKSPDPAGTVGKSITIKPFLDADIIKVYGRAGTPREAAAIANAVADAFVEQRLLAIRGEIAKQREFLEEQIPIVEAKLMESEEKVKIFKEKNKLVSLSAETETSTRELAEAERLYGEVEATLSSSKSRLESLEKQLVEQKTSLAEDITHVSSPHILGLRKELVELETDYSMYLVQGLQESDPQMRRLKKNIDETKSKLRQETRKIADKELPSLDPLSYAHQLVDQILILRVEISAQEAKKDALAKLRKRYERKLRALPMKELELSRLEREKELNKSTYLMLTQKYEEIKISEAGKVSNVGVVDRAVEPRFPVKPKKRLNLSLGIVVGLILGLGTAFLLEYLDTSIKTPKDIERYVKLPILGSIPRLKTSAETQDEISKIISHLLVKQPTKSHISEAYRSLRTNLQFINPDNPLKTILVTSTIPKEGKSTVSTNLSIAMAQMGEKVLLADTDLRKPILKKLFEIKSDKGITDVLIEKADLDSVIIPTKMENLSLLIAGKIPPNPSELLGSQKMEAVLEKLKEKFDFIVFDTPPAATVTDAAVLGAKVDGVLFVAQVGKVDREALFHVKEIFERVRAKILGVVLHMVPSTRGPYGYRYPYYYYHYYHYYPSEEKSVS